MDFGLPALFSFLRTGFVLFIAFGVVGFFLFQIFRLHREAAVCRHWPSVPGQVLQSGRTTRRKVGHRRSVVPFVLYQYEVGGSAYHSQRIHPGPPVGGVWMTQTVLGKYPVGRAVDVFYNPENHAEAVLEKGTPAAVFLWLAFGLILIFLFVFLGFSLWF